MKMLSSVFYPYKFGISAKSKFPEEIVALLFLPGGLPRSYSRADIFRSSPAETFSHTPTNCRSSNKLLMATTTGFSSATTTCSSADISSRRSSSVL